MATSTKLWLNFTRSNGGSMNLTYNHAKSNASAANVKALMQGIVANGNIFQKTPAAIKSAKIITTEETEVDLS